MIAGEARSTLREESQALSESSATPASGPAIQSGERGRQVELEDAPREQLADQRGAERGEQARDRAHGEELHPLRCR